MELLLRGLRQLLVPHLLQHPVQPLPRPQRCAYDQVLVELADGGVLDVADEQRVRGAVERRYRLRRERAVIDADTAASVSVADHRRVFAVAMATLLAEFNAYLDREGADPTADLVGYRQHALWLSPDERAELIGEMREVLVSRMGNEPSPERTRHLLSPVLFPAEEPPAVD
ncbi:ArsR family transcriptional regulator [Streptomyces tubercidicus]|nr:ArsR family transcriptional regulator [Streptomyces tubercidicus]WAU16781.1 ArsR family transcriptional regulator [Streptomyces tubercidicus]